MLVTNPILYLSQHRHTDFVVEISLVVINHLNNGLKSPFNLPRWGLFFYEH